MRMEVKEKNLCTKLYFPYQEKFYRDITVSGFKILAHFLPMSADEFELYGNLLYVD
jgi:hypothetical protein